MKKTLIALTALVAATVGFQSQAQAGYKYNAGSAIQLAVQFGDGYSDRRSSRHGYNRRHRCRIAGKSSIRRSLRLRGFYDIHRVSRHGRTYSAKAVSPRGHLVKLKINGCNHRIVKRKIIRSYPTVWSRNNSQRTYW